MAAGRLGHPLLPGAPPALENRATLSSVAPAAPGTSAFVSDPSHPVMDLYFWVRSARMTIASSRAAPISLTFDTAPLASDTEVTGPIDADLFVELQTVVTSTSGCACTR